VCTGHIGTFRHVERQALEIEDAEAAGLQVHIDQRHQHEHRAEEGVEEELDGGVDTPRSAPHADDEEHRHQHRFPEDVEQHRIERREHAVHQPFHDQEGRHVLRGLLPDHLPAGQHHQQRGEGGQDDQRHGDAVHAEVVVGVEGRDPGRQFLELHGRRTGIEMRVQQHAQQEGRAGGQQGGRAAVREAERLHRQQGHAARHRQPDQHAQQREIDHAPAPLPRKTNQNSSSSRPMIMLKA
jgi:hypothetical protein